MPRWTLRNRRRTRPPPRPSATRHRAWPRTRCPRTGEGSSTTAAAGAQPRPHARSTAAASAPRPLRVAAGSPATAGREHELEPRAVTDLRSERDPPPERLRELARDREAEAGSPTDIIGPERPEDPIDVVLRDPWPRVGHAHGDAAVVGDELEVDLAAVRRPPERVRQQIRDDLEHAVAVGEDRRRVVNVLPVVDPTPPRLVVEGGVCARDHL